MSRIGNRVLTIPANVSVDVNGKNVTVKGPKGELSLTLVNDINVKVEGNTLTVLKLKDSKIANQMHGTTNANINNMIKGVSADKDKLFYIVSVIMNQRLYDSSSGHINMKKVKMLKELCLIR